MTLVEILRAADEAGLRLSVKGNSLAISPAGRLTDTLRIELLRHKADLLELDRLHGLSYFAGSVGHPPPRAPWDQIGREMALPDGRRGILRAIEFDCRANRLRYCVEVAGERVIFEPGGKSAVRDSAKLTGEGR